MSSLIDIIGRKPTYNVRWINCLQLWFFHLSDTIFLMEANAPNIG